MNRQMTTANNLTLKNGIGKFRSPQYYLLKRKSNVYITQVYKSNFGFLESFFNIIEIKDHEVYVKFIESNIPFLVNQKSTEEMQKEKSYFKEDLFKQYEIPTDVENPYIADLLYVKSKIQPLLLLAFFTDGTYLLMDIDVKIKDNSDICVVNYCTNRQDRIIFEDVK